MTRPLRIAVTGCAEGAQCLALPLGDLVPPPRPGCVDGACVDLNRQAPWEGSPCRLR